MSRTLDAQTFGSLMVISGFAAAEGSACLLSAYPAMPLAWYLNLGPFRPFEMARAATSPLNVLYGPWTLHSSIALLSVTLIVRALKLRFAVALIANMSFAAAAALAYATFRDQAGARLGTLVMVEVLRCPDRMIIALMMASSLVSFALSHVSFVSRIRVKAKSDLCVA